MALGLTGLAGDFLGSATSKLTRSGGVTVVPRVTETWEDSVQKLTLALEAWLERPPLDDATRERCRATASRTAWSDLFEHYKTAYARALDSISDRSRRGMTQNRRPRPKLAVEPSSESRPQLRFFEVGATLPAHRITAGDAAEQGSQVAALSVHVVGELRAERRRRVSLQPVPQPVHPVHELKGRSLDVELLSVLDGLR